MRRSRRFALALLAACVLQAAAVGGAETPMDTVVVSGSREEVKRQIMGFVGSVTRVDGDLIGRWSDHICPMVVGLSDAQSQFMQRRLIEVQDSVRKFKGAGDAACNPNLFVIVTDDTEAVLASWKARDPGMFRWKTREGVSRSNGNGVVRTWHNAIMERADGGPTVGADMSGVTNSQAPQFKMKDSRIESNAAEHISAVVVLVDTRAAGKVTLSQLADYVTMVSLSQIDLSASVGNVSSILRLFAEPRPDVLPTALTDWDMAFLNGLYRTSYSPVHQRMDLTARMMRELAPP